MHPSPTPRPRRASYDDVLNAPDDVIAEILEGELVTSPRPTGAHSIAGMTLATDIGTPFYRGRGGPGGWWILYEPEVHLHDDVLVPDLAGWRRQRMPGRPEGPFIALAPDWVCEVLSPSTARIDRVRKLRIYAREGVCHAWLADPDARTLEVYRLEREHWVLAATFEGDEQARAEPFEAVGLDLLALWGEERAPEGEAPPGG